MVTLKGVFHRTLLTAETPQYHLPELRGKLMLQRNDFLFCFSLTPEQLALHCTRQGRQKAKSIHLRWVGFLKAMPYSIVAEYGLLQPQHGRLLSTRLFFLIARADANVPFATRSLLATTWLLHLHSSRTRRFLFRRFQLEVKLQRRSAPGGKQYLPMKFVRYSIAAVYYYPCFLLSQEFGTFLRIGKTCLSMSPLLAHALH